MFTLDSILFCTGYGNGKYSSEVGVKVNPIYGVPFVVLGKLLTDRIIDDADLHKPLKRFYSKKTRSYFYYLEG